MNTKRTVRRVKRKGVNAKELLTTMLIRLAQTSEINYEDLVDNLEVILYQGKFAEDYAKVHDNSKLIRSYNVQVW